MKQKSKPIIIGVAVGLIAILLALTGNPKNMALCIACFIRDTAGALGLHRAAPVQYIRPEIIGIVLGAFVISLFRKEFSSKGGSAPFTRFILGICVMVGALIFLGCPLRMVLRIAGGDLNALVGLVGFIGGAATGVLFLNKGFTLGKNHNQSAFEGSAFGISQILMLVLAVFGTALVIYSEEGPGSMHSPLYIALIAGLLAGAIGQYSRLCFVGGIRDVMMFRDFTMLIPFVAIIVTVAIGNIATGSFNLGFEGQPIAHTEHFWNIAGLYLVGLGSVLLGGCPFRQLVLAGSGNSDSAVTVVGLFAGAAIVHNFGLASSADGTTANGRVAFFICLIIVFAIGIINTIKPVKKA